MTTSWKQVWSAIALLAWMSAASSQNDPKTMGTCGAEKKKGDECALGICYSGKQTVYKCAEDKKCTKSEQQKACTEKK